MDFGLHVATDRSCFFSKLRSSGVQEPPKRLQERPKGVSRASNSLPRGPQESPKRRQEAPGSDFGAILDRSGIPWDLKQFRKKQKQCFF